MTTRRSFIAGMLSAAMKPDGGYVFCGLSGSGAITFEIPLPSRGHAAASYPSRPDAIVFARRPGTYAIVLDCRTGQTLARLEAPPGRHFYGHATFSTDGALLFTTENHYDVTAGIVGIWDARNQYSRIGEFSSGGIGPHDIKLMPNGEFIVVANGGIETHPDTWRMKLNLPTMRSNLSYLTLDGSVAEQMHLGAEHQRNSIRHLAVSNSDDVALAMQWQDALSSDLPLLGIHHRNSGNPELFREASVRAMQGYLGSIALNNVTSQIATTSPRTEVVLVVGEGGLSRRSNLTDVCGVVASGHGFIVTAGTGEVRGPATVSIRHRLAWDNHLVAI